MNGIAGFIVLVVIGLIIWAIVAANAKPPTPPGPPPGQFPPAFVRRQVPPAAPPDPGFEILSRTDLTPPQNLWPQEPAFGKPQQAGNLGDVTINLNAICMFTGTVARDCRCDLHRNLKG